MYNYIKKHCILSLNYKIKLIGLKIAKIFIGQRSGVLKLGNFKINHINGGRIL